MTGLITKLVAGSWVAIAEKDLTERYPSWWPSPGAPLTIDQARDLVDEGLIAMCHRYSGDQVSLEVYRWLKPMRPHRYFGACQPDTSRPAPDGTAALRIVEALTDRPERTQIIADRAGVHPDTARKALARLAAGGRVIRQYARHAQPLWSKAADEEAA